MTTFLKITVRVEGALKRSIECKKVAKLCATIDLLSRTLSSYRVKIEGGRDIFLFLTTTSTRSRAFTNLIRSFVSEVSILYFQLQQMLIPNCHLVIFIHLWLSAFESSFSMTKISSSLPNSMARLILKH